jgi:hypothetical protein
MSTLPSADRMAPARGQVLRRGHLGNVAGARPAHVRLQADHIRLGSAALFCSLSQLLDRNGVRAGLTEADIATAHRYAEASCEALARYDGKGKFDAATKEAAN